MIAVSRHALTCSALWESSQALNTFTLCKKNASHCPNIYFTFKTFSSLHLYRCGIIAMAAISNVNVFGLEMPSNVSFSMLQFLTFQCQCLFNQSSIWKLFSSIITQQQLINYATMSQNNFYQKENYKIQRSIICSSQRVVWRGQNHKTNC